MVFQVNEELDYHPLDVFNSLAPAQQPTLLRAKEYLLLAQAPSAHPVLSVEHVLSHLVLTRAPGHSCCSPLLKWGEGTQRG